MVKIEGNDNNESWCIIYLLIITTVIIEIVVKMIVTLLNKGNDK